MKAQVLLIFPVLCFVTVTLGAPTLSESQFKGDDLTKSFDGLNAPFIDAEDCFEDAEEYFQTQSKGLITSTSSNLALGSKCERKGNTQRNTIAFVEFLNPKSKKIHYFISIPDLEGKSHVYVVQVAPMLGEGGSGVVYLAKDIKIPNKFVAIKETQFGSGSELRGLELAGELLGRADHPLTNRWGIQMFLVIPFVPGIELRVLAEKIYKNGQPVATVQPDNGEPVDYGRRVYEYWRDEDNKGYYTMLHRIARDIVAPLMNKFLIHEDLSDRNMMVAQIDENYLPRETDPATGLQHFRAIDFGKHHEIYEGEDILPDINMLLMTIYLPYWPTRDFHQATKIFGNAVINALDKTKFDVELAENGMPKAVRRRRMLLHLEKCHLT